MSVPNTGDALRTLPGPATQAIRLPFPFGLTLMRLSGGKPLTLQTYQAADLIWVGAIILSLVLTLFMRETGTAARTARQT